MDVMKKKRFIRRDARMYHPNVLAVGINWKVILLSSSGGLVFFRRRHSLFRKVPGLSVWFFKDRVMNDGCLSLFGCWSSGKWFLTPVLEFCRRISSCCCTVSAMHSIPAIIT